VRFTRSIKQGRAARTTTCRFVKLAIVAASELLVADGAQPETQN
jgi:hypothetical protein